VGDLTRSTKFYKVKFTEVIDLVATRQVFLRNGLAFVPQYDIASILGARFRTMLSKRMVHANKALPTTVHDDRILDALKKLQQASSSSPGPVLARSGGGVAPQELPRVAGESFPMCMREMNRELSQRHHLKHQGRLEFTLFLKGIGLSMDDCIAYMRQELLKNGRMKPDEFTRHYQYNIRHAYGKEGKRMDYPPHSCKKILSGSAPTGDQQHGCPYKNYSVQNMTTALVRHKLEQGQVREITSLMEKNGYQLACRKHFELTHPGFNHEAVGNHPNAFFDESRKYHGKKQ
jgi:DNA primase large subunit